MYIESSKSRLNLLFIAVLMLSPVGAQATDTKTTSHNLEHDLVKTDDGSHTHTTVASTTGTSGKSTSHNTDVDVGEHKYKSSEHGHGFDPMAPTPGDNAR